MRSLPGLLAVALAVSLAAHAQDYPNKPVHAKVVKDIGLKLD